MGVSGKRNIMLVLEYDGADYAGFQWQPGRPTVQAELEKAIAALTGEAVRVIAAGRTDAGVHALGQVVNFRTESALPAATVQRGLNALLPAAVAVRQAADVADDFHARYSALSRSYRYTILNAPLRSPLRRLTSYHVPAPLAVERMAQAAQALLGTHDFAAFGGPMRAEGTTMRTVYRIGCRREGELVLLDIEANAYLSRMVRSIAGTLIDVGRGKLPEDEVAAILAAAERRRARPSAAACGLCLMSIRYD